MPHKLLEKIYYFISAIYLRRFKKEKKLRRKLQEELEFESKKRKQFEDAINSLPPTPGNFAHLQQLHLMNLQLIT